MDISGYPFLYLKWLIIFTIPSLVLFLVRKYFPAKHKQSPYQVNPKEIEVIRKKFRVVESILSFSLTLIPWGIGTWIFFMLFTRLYLLYFKWVYFEMKSKSIYFIGIDTAAFSFPAMVLAAVIALYLCPFLYPLLGKMFASSKKEWEIYYFDFMRRMDYDNNKASKVLSYGLVIFTVIFTFLALNNYWKITSNSILYNKFLGINEKEYSFDQVSKIFLVEQFKNKKPNKIEPVKVPYYKVIMEDGSGWEIRSEYKDVFKHSEDKEIIDYISQKSGVFVQKGTVNLDF